MTKLPIAVVVGVLCCLQLTHGSIEPVTLTSFMSIMPSSSMDVITITLDFSTIFPSSTLLPSPTPLPPRPPTDNFFPLYDRNNQTCAIVAGHIELFLTYKNDSTNKNITHKVTVNDLTPKINRVEKCNNESINMNITFTNNSAEHMITFHFNESSKDKRYELRGVSVLLNTNDNTYVFPNYTTTNGTLTGSTNEKDGIFSVDKSKSYRCKKTREFSMDSTPDLQLKLHLSNFQAQAFEFDKNPGDFDKAVDCTADQTSSKVVPIAVGAALAGLVVVVLIAYLIGRFRSRKQNSYEALS